MLRSLNIPIMVFAFDRSYLKMTPAGPKKQLAGGHAGLYCPVTDEVLMHADDFVDSLRLAGDQIWLSREYALSFSGDNGLVPPGDRVGLEYHYNKCRQIILNCWTEEFGVWARHWVSFYFGTEYCRGRCTLDGTTFKGLDEEVSSGLYVPLDGGQLTLKELFLECEANFDDIWTWKAEWDDCP